MDRRNVDGVVVTMLDRPRDGDPRGAEGLNIVGVAGTIGDAAKPGHFVPHGAWCLPPVTAA